MPEVIAFPDVEKFTVAFLKAQFTDRSIDVKVGTKVPKTMPDQFVRVSRTGGTSKNLVTDGATVLVECFGHDTVAPSDTARVARALLLAAGRLTDDVTRAVDGGGIAFNPDPDTNLPRYQFLVQLDMKGFAL